MSSAKWIAGFLGWVTWGPIGALLGFLAGTVLDNAIDAASQLTGGDTLSRGYSSSARPTGAGGFSAAEQRNSFFVSLLVLSSAVIRADGNNDIYCL